MLSCKLYIIFKFFFPWFFSESSFKFGPMVWYIVVKLRLIGISRYNNSVYWGNHIGYRILVPLFQWSLHYSRDLVLADKFGRRVKMLTICHHRWLRKLICQHLHQRQKKKWNNIFIIGFYFPHMRKDSVYFMRFLKYY